MNIGRFRQFHTAFGNGFGSFTMSLINGWPAYTSELYRSNTTTPMSSTMTKAEEALLGSLPSLGAMLGVAVTGFLINNFGRRNGSVILSLPVLISWAVINITSSLKLVLVARFLGGITGGGSLILTPIFISEVAEDAIRGTLASSSVFLYCMGLMIAYIMGWKLQYRTVIWINLIVCTMSTIILTLVTESPVYFLRRNKDEDAKVSIAKYRGLPVSSPVVLDELTKLKQQLMPSVELVSITEADAKAVEAETEKLSVEEVMPITQQSTSVVKFLFLEPASRRAFLILTWVISMQVFMGNVPIQVYAKTVFTEAAPKEANLYTILYAVVLFIGSTVSAAVTDKAGRRILIISSSALAFISLITLGYLLQFRVAPPIFIVIVIFAYCFFFIFGAGSIPYVLLAEVFIPEVQNFASTVIIELVWLLNFLILAVFPYMNTAFGIHGSFYIFGSASLANAIFSFFFVPETKGLSNSQIQEILLRKRN